MCGDVTKIIYPQPSGAKETSTIRTFDKIEKGW
jgi:hypothetical protein